MYTDTNWLNEQWLLGVFLCHSKITEYYFHCVWTKIKLKHKDSLTQNLFIFKLNWQFPATGKWEMFHMYYLSSWYQWGKGKKIHVDCCCVWGLQTISYKRHVSLSQSAREQALWHLVIPEQMDHTISAYAPEGKSPQWRSWQTTEESRCLFYCTVPFKFVISKPHQRRTQ